MQYAYYVWLLPLKQYTALCCLKFSKSLPKLVSNQMSPKTFIQSAVTIAFWHTVSIWVTSTILSWETIQMCVCLQQPEQKGVKTAPVFVDHKMLKLPMWLVWNVSTLVNITCYCNIISGWTGKTLICHWPLIMFNLKLVWVTCTTLEYTCSVAN